VFILEGIGKGTEGKEQREEFLIRGQEGRAKARGKGRGN